MCCLTLSGRKDVRPVKSWVLLVWRWGFDWSFVSLHVWNLQLMLPSPTSLAPTKSTMETFCHRLTRIILEMAIKRVSPRCQFGHKYWSAILAPRGPPCRVVGFGGPCKVIRHLVWSPYKICGSIWAYAGIPNSFWKPWDSTLEFWTDRHTDWQKWYIYIITCLRATVVAM